MVGNELLPSPDFCESGSLLCAYAALALVMSSSRCLYCCSTLMASCCRERVAWWVKPYPRPASSAPHLRTCG